MSAPDIASTAIAIESALTDLVEKLEQINAAGGLALVHGALTDAVEAMEKRSINLAPLIEAIGRLQPTVHVHVPPAPAAPAPVVQLVPAAEFEVRIKDQFGGPDRVMSITRRQA